MKTKKEEKDRLNKISIEDKEELQSLIHKIEFLIRKGEITEETLKELQALIVHLMIKREQYFYRLLSLLKQGYQE